MKREERISRRKLEKRLLCIHDMSNDSDILILKKDQGNKQIIEGLRAQRNLEKSYIDKVNEYKSSPY